MTENKRPAMVPRETLSVALLESIGWEILNFEVNTCEKTVRLELRSGSRLVTYDYRNGRSSVVRETQEKRTEKCGRKGDRFLAETVSTRFLGRDRFPGMRSGFRYLSHYIQDNTGIGAQLVKTALVPLLTCATRITETSVEETDR